MIFRQLFDPVSSTYTYILASKRKGALFVGMTRDMTSCITNHRLNQVEGLTSLYAIHQLVHLESFEKAGPALLRESQLKKMPRRARIDRVFHQLLHDARRPLDDLAGGDLVDQRLWKSVDRHG